MKVIAIWAQSIDGKIAQEPDDSLKWVSKEDKQHFKEATQKGGAIIIGRSTYEQIGKPLPKRLNVVMTSHADEFKSQEIQNVLEFTNLTAKELLKSLHARGYETIFISGGSKIYSQFTEQSLVDEWWITIEPYLFGHGIPAVTLEQPLRLALLEQQQLNQNTILLKYGRTD